MVINHHHNLPDPKVKSKIVLFSLINSNSKKHIQFRAEIINQLIDRKSIVNSVDD